MAIRKKKAVLAKPAKQFPPEHLIGMHVYDPSGLPTQTCTKCGKLIDYKLHLRTHTYSRNYDSKLRRCMCGQRKEHPIHRKGIS